MIGRGVRVGGLRGGRADWRCACLRRSTPHLASPLEGGRDELGGGGKLGGGGGGSCLRRNDGKGGAGVTG